MELKNLLSLLLVRRFRHEKFKWSETWWCWVNFFLSSNAPHETWAFVKLKNSLNKTEIDQIKIAKNMDCMSRIVNLWRNRRFFRFRKFCVVQHFISRLFCFSIQFTKTPRFSLSSFYVKKIPTLSWFQQFLLFIYLRHVDIMRTSKFLYMVDWRREWNWIEANETFFSCEIIEKFRTTGAHLICRTRNWRMFRQVEIWVTKEDKKSFVHREKFEESNERDCLI